MAFLALFMVVFLAITGYSNAAYCVCNAGLSDSVLQKNIDYACGAGADCGQIQQNGPCFNPNTVKDHCNFAVNSYYQKKGQVEGSCSFSGTATVSPNPPSGANSACYSSTSTPTPTNPAPTPTGTGNGTPAPPGVGTGTPTPPGVGTGTPVPGTVTPTPPGTGNGTPGTGTGTPPGVGTGNGSGTPGSGTLAPGINSVNPPFGQGPSGTNGLNDNSDAVIIHRCTTMTAAFFTLLTLFVSGLI